MIVVTGPPCAGKSTYVRQHADPRTDVVVDLDLLAHALGYPTEQIDWTLEHSARDAARVARIAVIDAAFADEWPGETWVIDSDPSRTTRAIYRRAGADVLDIDPGLEVCLERARARSAGAVEAVRAWFEGHAGDADERVGAWRI